MIAKFVFAAAVPLKVAQIANRGLSDIVQCFRREKRLMRSNDNVGHCYKPCENIVGHDMSRKILEKHVGFFFVNVKAGGAHFAALDSFEQRFRIDERAA